MNELNTFSNFSISWCSSGTLWHEIRNLNNETVKILGVHFSYDKNLEQDKNFCEHIIKIENILKLWRMRQLTLNLKLT